MGGDPAVTWSRKVAATALADTLRSSIEAAGGNGVTVFERPPATLNVPALVISRQATVDYGVEAFGVDVAQLPVVCLGALGDVDQVDELVGIVLDAVDDDRTLGGAVRSCTPNSTRNWRAQKIGGADTLALDLLLDITM